MNGSERGLCEAGSIGGQLFGGNCLLTNLTWTLSRCPCAAGIEGAQSGPLQYCCAGQGGLPGAHARSRRQALRHGAHILINHKPWNLFPWPWRAWRKKVAWTSTGRYAKRGCCTGMILAQRHKLDAGAASVEWTWGSSRTTWMLQQQPGLHASPCDACPDPCVAVACPHLCKQCDQLIELMSLLPGKATQDQVGRVLGPGCHGAVPAAR